MSCSRITKPNEYHPTCTQNVYELCGEGYFLDKEWGRRERIASDQQANGTEQNVN